MGQARSKQGGKPSSPSHALDFARKTALYDVSNNPSVKAIPREVLDLPLKVITISHTGVALLALPARPGMLTKLLCNGSKLKGEQPDLSSCTALKVLSVAGNELESLPMLPISLSNLDASSNARLCASSWPLARSGPLLCLAFLDLSRTGCRQLPVAITSLTSLQDLILDGNVLETLELLRDADEQGASGGAAFIPQAGWGALGKLRTLSVAGNRIQALPGVLPRELLEDTPLVALNLRGNAGLSVQWVLSVEGYKLFEERRAKHRSKGITGDGGVYGLQDGSTCGLD